MYNLSIPYSATYVHSSPYGSSRGSLRVYIPTIMPSIAMGTPKIIPISLNKSCYCNANDCRPSVASQINTQNFVTALPSFNQYNGSCYWYGDGIKVFAKTTDFLNCQLTPEEEDNSTPFPYEEEDS